MHVEYCRQIHERIINCRYESIFFFSVFVICHEHPCNRLIEYFPSNTNCFSRFSFNRKVISSLRRLAPQWFYSYPVPVRFNSNNITEMEACVDTYSFVDRF